MAKEYIFYRQKSLIGQLYNFCWYSLWSNIFNTILLLVVHLEVPKVKLKKKVSFKDEVKVEFTDITTRQEDGLEVNDNPDDKSRVSEEKG